MFRVHNSGHTDAHEVTVIFTPPGEVERAVLLGDIPSKGSAEVPLGDEKIERAILELMLLTDDPWKVHWSSPLGHAEDWTYPGKLIR